MEAEFRELQRQSAAHPNDPIARERLLRAHERRGDHVHSTISIGVEKMCTTCPARWEIAGERGNYYWAEIPRLPLDS